MSNHSEERKFLHDIASPLATAMFLMDALTDDLIEKCGKGSSEVEQVTTVYKALQAMQKLLTERRQLLIQNSATSEE